MAVESTTSAKRQVTVRISSGGSPPGIAATGN